MKPYFLSIVLLLHGMVTFAQECNCPPGGGDDAQTLKTFRFGNGQQLGVCGFNTIEGDDTSYTQFALFLCGDNKPLARWDANFTCKAEQTKDALLVKEMYNLPVGQNFSTLWRPFFIHKYSFKNGKIEETGYYNQELDHYTKEQIAEVISQYNALPSESNEETMKVANMLFWAIVSGSKEAEALLKSMPGRFGPFSGPIAEEWKDINVRYEQWQKVR
jgi:hypothetical protein